VKHGSSAERTLSATSNANGKTSGGIVKKNLSAYIEAVILLSVLSIPVGLIAQNDQQPLHQPHHYQVVDLGSTFGGPQSYFVPGSGLEFVGSSVLNQRGAVAGFADTATSDPFPKFCFSDCFVSHAFEAGRGGVLKDLGALPGGGSSAPMWISANGLIAGISENGKTDPLYKGLPEMRAVLWQKGNIGDLGTLEHGHQSEANAVNSSGQVVGTALNTIADANSMAVANYWYFDVAYGYQSRAFLWDEEKGMQDLGTLPGGTDAQAIFINERGQVVGDSYTGSTQKGACFPLASRTFLWEKKKRMIDLGSFGGSCTAAAALNNHGQVTGESLRKGDNAGPAFLWENGQLHELGGSLGGAFTGGQAINEQGKVAGFGYLQGNKTFHATLWQNLKAITDLGVIGNDPCSYAAAINVKMQVVGGSSPTCDFGDKSRAFLWERGSIFDLNSLIPPGSALYLQLTYAINDRSEIAGTGVDSTGNEHAFLLVPCDENHPGIEGCDYSLVDADTAARVSAPPVIERPPSANDGSPIRQLLRRRMGSVSHILNRTTNVVGDSTTPISQNSDWHLEDRIVLDDGVEVASSSSSMSVWNTDQNSCPRLHCSPRYTNRKYCGAGLCNEHIYIIYKAYDLKYHRECVLPVCSQD
jgi:probable HAF family extracellular repeat protein